MRNILGFMFLGLAVTLHMATLPAQPKAPAKVVFKAKTGDVTFDHEAHSKREKDECEVCHDKLFKQDAKAPLDYKANMHKKSEAEKTSCGACHVEGGKSFASKGNCTNSKCHVKGS